MDDRLESLKQLADAPVRPLPAEEVRRRGNRLRVRRTAFQAVGAAAAVAVVVTGGVVVTGSPDSAPPPITRHTHAPAPTPTPSPGQPGPTHTARRAPADPVPGTPLRIQDGVPLADGWPPITEHGGPDGLFGPSSSVKPLRLGNCRRPAAGARDRVTARWVQPQDIRGRELSVFRSVADAEAYEAAIVQGYLDCPPDQNLPPVRWTEGRFPVRGHRARPEGHVLLMTVGTTGAPAPGGESVIVVRTGAAVWSGSPTTRARASGPPGSTAVPPTERSAGPSTRWARSTSRATPATTTCSSTTSPAACATPVR